MFSLVLVGGLSFVMRRCWISRKGRDVTRGADGTIMIVGVCGRSALSTNGVMIANSAARSNKLKDVSMSSRVYDRGKAMGETKVNNETYRQQIRSQGHGQRKGDI